MKKILLAGVAALLLATEAHADGPKQTLIGEWYLNGLVAGLMAASVAIESKGQPGLFCPPENLTITGAMLDDMMRNFGKEHPELKSKSYASHIPTMALFVLQDTFPCKPQ
jgi:hypothetical protein